MLQHLERRGVRRRANVGGLNDQDVKLPVDYYLADEAMQQLCDDFAVDPETMQRELKVAGVPLRKPGRSRRSSV